MKKIMVLSILICVFILSSCLYSQNPCDLSNQAPCPAGLTGPYCFTMNYYSQSKQAWLNVAVYYCLGTNGGITESIHHWDIIDGEGNAVYIALDNSDFQGKIWEAIDNDVYTNHPTSFPPCSSGNSYIMVSHKSINCVKMINDGPHQISRIMPCTNSQYICTDYYKVCYNTTTGILIRTYDHSDPVYSPDCPKFDPSFWQPPVGKTWTDYFETNCSYWDCPSH